MSDIVSIKIPRDELHNKLGGGLPKDSLILIEGRDGDGKSIMAQRFTYALLEGGHELTYMSTELDTMGFIKQMQSVEYDIEKYILQDKLTFVSAYPSFGNPEITGHNFDELVKKKKLFEKEYIVMDTLSSFLVEKNIDLKRAFEIVRFFKKVIALNKTLLITVNPDEINPVVFGLLKNASDVYIIMETKEVLGNLRKIIRVIRFQRAAGDVTILTPIKVQPKIGISIELAAI